MPIHGLPIIYLMHPAAPSCRLPHRASSSRHSHKFSWFILIRGYLALSYLESFRPSRARPWSCRPLLSLLWGSLSTSEVLPHISGINSLSRQVLDSIPGVLGRRRNVLLVDLLINSCRELAEGTLNKCALVESCSQEDSVQTKQHPCAFAESKSGEEETTPQSDFEGCHEHHAAIIVLLDKSTDHGTDSALRLGLLRRLARSCWLLLLESWEDVRAGVCCNVENGVHAEWQ